MKVYQIAVAWFCVFAVQANAQIIEARKAMEPYLDSEIILVGHADIQSLDITNAAKAIGTPPEGIMFFQSTVDRLKAAGISSVAFAGGAGGLVGDTTQLAALVRCNEPAKALAAIKTVPGLQSAVSEVTLGGCFVGLNQQAIDWLKIQRGEPRSSLVNAAKLCNGKQGIAIAIPPDLLATLNAMLGQSQPLTEGLADLNWIAGWGDLTTVDLNLVADYASVEAATKANRSIKDAAIASLKIAMPINQNAVQLRLELKSDSAFVSELSKISNANVSSMQSGNNMKQLSLALHNFYDEHRCLPPQALMSKDGKPLLSWRVLLLPYLDGGDLYKKFRLDEAWDSPHNLPLANQMPALFKTVGWDSPGGIQTRYLAPLAKNSAMGIPGVPVTFAQVTDGTSNTIWLVETAPSKSAVWTKPEDLTIDPKKPLKDIAVDGSDRFLAARLDGSVNVVATRISAVANAMFSINGGELHEDPRP